MKKYMILASVLLLSLPGCWHKKKCCPATHVVESESFDSASIPLVDTDELDIDESVEDFVESEEMMQTAQSLDIAEVDEILKSVRADEDAQAEQDSFRTVFFDFDKDTIRPDQESVVAANITFAKKKLDEHAERGVSLSPMTIVIEGHSDSVALSSAYNLALSEKRAKTLKERFVAAGIPDYMVKTVGRGDEFPAYREGKVVDGDRVAQWPNRRNEIKVIYA